MKNCKNGIVVEMTHQQTQMSYNQTKNDKIASIVKYSSSQHYLLSV